MGANAKMARLASPLGRRGPPSSVRKSDVTDRSMRTQCSSLRGSCRIPSSGVSNQSDFVGLHLGILRPIVNDVHMQVITRRANGPYLTQASPRAEGDIRSERLRALREMPMSSEMFQNQTIGNIKRPYSEHTLHCRRIDGGMVR
jgi:hypothetical protein